MEMEEIRVSAECAPNIAVIKYWGKADEDLILPLNGSISVTLDREVLRTSTTLVLARPKSRESSESRPCLRIEIEVNGGREAFDEAGLDLKLEAAGGADGDPEHKMNRKRFLRVLNKIRERSQLDAPFSFDLLKITSQNFFPSACGLASSASGFACLAMCLARAFQYAPTESVSELARLGSGSACRSCFGGFVKWSKGADSASSTASQILPATHWPELNVLVVVFEDAKKKVSSTHGMRETTLTSELLRRRVELVESERLVSMESYLARRDFSNFAKLTIQESNSFHATCLDTYPPLFYLNDHSKDLINMIHEFNRASLTEVNAATTPSKRGEAEEAIKCAYTFDAGPNAFLFVLDDYLNDLLYLLNRVYFSSQSPREFIEKSVGISKATVSETLASYAQAQSRLDSLYQRFLVNSAASKTNAIKFIYHSKVGKEPLIS